MHNNLLSIVPGNESLEYLERRIKDSRYRGPISSQHNRYTMNQVYIILSLFYQHVGEDLMHLRTQDIKKRPHNTPQEVIYASFCDKAKEAAGIGTQDAMRKNLFPDFHRMGLINRYDSKRQPIDPYDKSGGITRAYASLTKRGLKFISPQASLLTRQLIFSRAVDTLLKGFITVLMHILVKNPKIKKISDYEFMFFISGVQTNSEEKFTFSVSIAESIDLLNSFRNLSLIQRRAVINYCNTYFVPHNYHGNKTQKRDFHNWKNKTQQIFFLLEQTAYFDAHSGYISLRTSNKEFGESVRLNRSDKPKQEYLKFHNLPKKTKGFELHHVVPLSWAESPEHFKLFDNWKNLVYIDGYNHARITQNGSRNIYMDGNGMNIILSDRVESEIELKHNQNIRYNIDHQTLMLGYNRELTSL